MPHQTGRPHRARWLLFRIILPICTESNTSEVKDSWRTLNPHWASTFGEIVFLRSVRYPALRPDAGRWTENNCIQVDSRHKQFYNPAVLRETSRGGVKDGAYP